MTKFKPMRLNMFSCGVHQTEREEKARTVGPLNNT